MPTDSHPPKARLAAHLKDAILTMALQPGEDLDEAALSAAFGLSRTPLREVFRDLAGQGYLDGRANRGMRVAALTHTALRAFFQSAPMIYGAVAQLAALHATAAQIKALKQAQSAFGLSLQREDAQARALANTRFHDVMGEMAANPYLYPSYQRLLIDHTRIGVTFYETGRPDRVEKLAEASAQHDAMIAAIEARDPAEAQRLSDAHWALSRDEIALFVLPEGVSGPLGDVPKEVVT